MKKKSNKGVYIIINVVNKKVYVGSTTNSFTKRFYDHKRKLRKGVHNNEHLQNAWNKYGEDSFIFSILEVIEDNITIRNREKYYIDFYNSCNREFGYNINSETEFHCIEQSAKDKLSSYMKNAWKEGKYSGNLYKGKSSWNKGIKCENISTTRRINSPSVEVYMENILIATFRSITDLSEWTKTNVLPGLTFSVDKTKRTTKGKFTSYLLGTNIQRAIRNNAKYRGLYFKRTLPLSSEMGIVKWENCWNGEIPNQQPSQPLTKLEGSETNS